MANEMEVRRFLVNEIQFHQRRRQHAISLLANDMSWCFRMLGPLLMASQGCMRGLCEEIEAILPSFNAGILTRPNYLRAFNTLKLFHCIASNAATRVVFTRARFPAYLFGFLNTENRSHDYEQLRLKALDVMSSLLLLEDNNDQNNNDAIIQPLLHMGFMTNGDLLSACLRSIVCGAWQSKLVATSFIKNMLSNHNCRDYVCNGWRLLEINHVLEYALVQMVHQGPSHSTPLLIIHIIGCYICLAENNRGRNVLRRILPAVLMDGSLVFHIQNNQEARSSLYRLRGTIQM